MSEILSYYSKSNGRVIKETLYEHINEALKIVQGIEESKIGKYMYTIFPKIRNFSELVELTIVFHDVGKVFYQKDINEIREYASFLGHEFFSAYMFKQFWSNEIINSEETFGIDIEDPITFAILFHHHAMDVNRRISSLKPEHININKGVSLFEVLLKNVESFLNVKYKNSFANSLDTVREKLKNESLVVSGIKEETKNTVKDIWEEIWLDKDKKKFSLILLDILLIADNIAAKNRRGHSISTFTQTLIDFYDLFIRKSAEKML